MSVKATRAVALPAAAIALVAAVLGAQVAAGGGDFVPTRAADPCVPRSVGSVGAGLEALSDQLILLGLDGAACRLGRTREALVLALAMPAEPSEEEIEALRAGLGDAIDRLDREDRLPPSSDLADEALAQADLPALMKRVITLAPDALIDRALPTADVLRRSVAELDLRTLLGDLDDPSRINVLIRDAVVEGVKDSVLARLRGLR
ncbi:MAG: hypothetical protein ACT4PP_15640 [Sporichthyaceae bacterium]